MVTWEAARVINTTGNDISGFLLKLQPDLSNLMEVFLSLLSTFSIELIANILNFLDPRTMFLLRKQCESDERIPPLVVDFLYPKKFRYLPSIKLLAVTVPKLCYITIDSLDTVTLGLYCYVPDHL